MNIRSFDPFQTNRTVETSKLISCANAYLIWCPYIDQKTTILNPQIFRYFFIIYYFGRVFCSILFGMKGGDSEFPTYLLHYYVLCRSATNRWESQIHCPSYRIKSSKVEDVVVMVFFVQNHTEAGLENDCKRLDARYLGTRELLSWIRARPYLYYHLLHLCTQMIHSLHLYLRLSLHSTQVPLTRILPPVTCQLTLKLEPTHYAIECLINQLPVPQSVTNPENYITVLLHSML